MDGTGFERPQPSFLATSLLSVNFHDMFLFVYVMGIGSCCLLLCCCCLLLVMVRKQGGQEEGNCSCILILYYLLKKDCRFRRRDCA
ncbi:hypothetical protein E2C01_078530 [Portunus trituberculatus]|uniref:Uncharacterized protein n=1 Tax=Portunus trituberculatus TaxID=210409 RepID=A0A5B7IJ17_PORTR|nr:hypothetical protein [Portunus trituberculatus]